MRHELVFPLGLSLLFGCMALDDNDRDEDSTALESGSDTRTDEPEKAANNNKAAGPDNVYFECSVTGNNAGCSINAVCPNGMSIGEIRAACNLENGLVTDQQIEYTYVNTIKIVRGSDNVYDGKCTITSGFVYGFSYGNQAVTGAMKVVTVIGKTSIVASCDEQDKNGGDCHIRGWMVCE